MMIKTHKRKKKQHHWIEKVNVNVGRRAVEARGNNVYTTTHRTRSFNRK